MSVSQNIEIVKQANNAFNTVGAEGFAEFLNEDDNLEKALNYFVMGVHQPLIVKNGDEVTGILRFGDVFEIVREHLLKGC